MQVLVSEISHFRGNSARHAGNSPAKDAISLSNEQPADRLVAVNPLNGLTQEGGDAENRELRNLFLGRQWDGVG